MTPTSPRTAMDARSGVHADVSLLVADVERSSGFTTATGLDRSAYESFCDAGARITLAPL